MTYIPTRLINAAIERLVEKSTLIYLEKLPDRRLPRTEELRAAHAEVERITRDEIRNPRRFSEITEIQDISLESMPLLMADFRDWMEAHPIVLPEPLVLPELDGLRVSVAAIIGALLGGFTFTPFFNLLMDMPQLGWVVGAPVGAGGLVYILWRASDSEAFRKTLQISLGVATFAEVLLAINGALGFGGLWRALRGASGKAIPGFIKRIGIYLAAILFLKLGVRRPVYRKSAYKHIVATYLNMWWRSTLLFFRLKRLEQDSDRPGHPSESEWQTTISGYLHQLQRTKSADLPSVAAELLQKARHLGLEGLERQPAFLDEDHIELTELAWQKTLADRYHTLGEIEDGEKVFVEREAIIQNGAVLKKGLVRRSRGGRK